MTTRIHAFLNAVLARLKSDLPVRDLRMQIDPFDVNAFIDRESFREAALRVVFGEAQPQPRGDGSFNLDLGFAVFIGAMREGRADVEKASADLRAVSLALDVWAAIGRDPYVGVAQIGPVTPKPMRVLASELTNDKGFALVVLEFSVTLYGVIDTARSIGVAAGTILPPYDGFSVNDGPVEAIPPETAP